ncbi:hypothetical protein E2P81_ATG07360 [Venturia nashicola]|nr:hypothetical protein E2P81_ATG07360 [Venturia nashicola]
MKFTEIITLFLASGATAAKVWTQCVQSEGRCYVLDAQGHTTQSWQECSVVPKNLFPSLRHSWIIRR